jgi:hypothetical protein
MKVFIGYNRTVKLAWLEAAAGLAAAGKSDSDIYQALREMLKDQLSLESNAKRGSREKTITLLLKTWVRVPGELSAFRQRALNLFKTQPTSNHIILHWAMSFATYPFCKIVAEVLGRALILQGTAVAAQVQRRVRELLGERETVSRSTRYVIRAFQDWGVIESSGRQGIYRPMPAITITDPTMASFLLEGYLRANNNDPVTSGILQATPALFPFELSHLNLGQVLADPRFDVSRQALNQDLVRLRLAFSEEPSPPRKTASK